MNNIKNGGLFETMLDYCALLMKFLQEYLGNDKKLHGYSVYYTFQDN